MSTIFVDNLKTFLGKLNFFLRDRGPYISSIDSPEYDEILHELQVIQDNIPIEEKSVRYKRLNLYISIIPTIVAIILTAWVFSFSMKNSVRNHKLQMIDSLKDSVINLSNQLIITQKAEFKIDSITKIDSIIKRLSTRDSGEKNYYFRNGTAQIVLDMYLENIRIINEIEKKIDTLNIKILRARP